MKRKIICLVVLIMSLYGVAVWTIQQKIVLPGFLELERKEALSDMNRAVSTMKREILVLDSQCHDYAAWDDTYAFIKDHNERYLESNIVEETYQDLHLNLILFYDAQGNFVAGGGYDLIREAFIRPDDIIAIRPGHPLLAHTTTTDTISGLIATSREPMLVSSQSIITSANDGPVRGSFIVGYFLDNARMTQLKKQLGLDLSALSVKSSPLSAEDQAALTKLENGAENFVTSKESKTILNAYSLFPDIYGKPIILLKAALPRDIFAIGLTTVKDSRLTNFFAGFVVIIGLMIAIHFLIANPTTRLVRHLNTLKETGELKAIAFAGRKDEIGALYEGFNALTEQLIEKNRARAVIEAENEALIAELQEALAKVHMLSGLLPICSSCKMIRDENGQWNKIEWYIKQHSAVEFSHGICPDCAKKYYAQLP